MLTLTTLDVDFTNVFRARFLRRFSYKRLFSSYVLRSALVKSTLDVDLNAIHFLLT